MVFDLNQLFNGAEQLVSFSRELDLSRLEQWGTTPFLSPVPLAGKVENRAGIVTLDYEVTLSYTVPCDRCLDPVREEGRKLHFVHTLIRDLSREEDEDNFIVLPDGILNLQELAEADIILELPSKILCSEDCRGLCPRCGKNLNEGPCDCKPDVDPRWEALRQLLEQ